MAENDAKIPPMKHLKMINQFLTPRYLGTIYFLVYTIVKHIEIL